MRKINLTFVFALSLVLFISSCSKNGSTGPAGPAGPSGPSYTGAISGHVDLYDQYGSKVLNGVTSVVLSLNGGSNQSPNSSGYYIFGGVTTGSYNITATNNGFGNTRINNFQYLSDTLNHDVKLSAIPDFSPTAFTAAKTASSGNDSLVLTFTADTRARNCIVFANSNSTVNNMPANYLQVYTKAIPVNATRVVIMVPSQDLTDVGIASGATVYYSAYGYVVGDVSSYEDLSTGKVMYTPVSASPMVANAVAP